MLHRQRWIGLLILVALLMTACQPITIPTDARAQTPTDEDVIAAVNSIWDEYEASVIASDAERWIAQWTDDGVQMPPNESFVEGKENILARVGAVMQVVPADEFVITPLETQSAGNWAYSRGVYTVTYTVSETDEQGFVDGKFMTILQREPDGSWKIHRDIFNSNVPPTAEEADVTAVTEAVLAIWEEYSASLNAGDVDRWVELWTKEGIQLPPSEPPVVGKEAIRSRNKAALTDLFEIEMSITNEEVQVGGEWAVARGVYIATLTPKAGGDDILVDGKYMTLLQRQEDGSWKIYRDIFNSNVPPVAPVTVEEADVEAVTEAVLAIWEEYSASLNAGDAERWVNLWADAGTQLPPNSPPVVGKEAIRESIKANMDSFIYDMTITNEEVQVGGEWAVARGVYTATLTPKAGGEEVLVDGKYMTLLQRQDDGSWKIYRDIFNSNVPPNN